MQSHPTWVRGLKHVMRLTFHTVICVAPYVGAWIETRYLQTQSEQMRVAPYVGAWIETENAL